VRKAPLRRWILVGGLASVFVSTGIWWLWRTAPEHRSASVVIYLVDTLRADRLGVYGYGRHTSPRIDALAAESAVFEQAYAPAPWTVPSVASLITSTYPCEHGVVKENTRLNPVLKTLAERLESAGYFTGGAYSNVYVSALLGLDRGYQAYDPWSSGMEDDVSELARRADGRPFYFYLHTMEPHDPDKTPDAFVRRVGHVGPDARQEFGQTLRRYHKLRQVDWSAGRPVGTTDNSGEQDRALARLERLREHADVLYDASIVWADSNLGYIIDALEKSRAWDETIFVFLSDHGEEFGEHGGWVHAQSVYEELARAPLIIHFPDDEFAGLRVDDPVSLVDLMPTILDYLGRPDLCDGCRGVSLLPLLRGTGGREPGQTSIPAMRLNESHYYRPFKESRGDVNVVLRQGDWKGIWNAEHRALELYDLGLDPSEHSDVSARNPELSRSLGEQAEAWLEACRAQRVEPERVTELPEAVKDQLRALGYLD
jgi:arylsulfatase A-like enzyme